MNNLEFFSAKSEMVEWGIFLKLFAVELLSTESYITTLYNMSSLFATASKYNVI